MVLGLTMTRDLNHFYEFGLFQLDAAERRLLREGKAVPLTPKAFDLLVVLVNRHGSLLEKNELLQPVWADSFVEENNLADNISTLRKVLGQGENGQQYIETVPNRGHPLSRPKLSDRTFHLLPPPDTSFAYHTALSLPRQSKNCVL